MEEKRHQSDADSSMSWLPWQHQSMNEIAFASLLASSSFPVRLPPPYIDQDNLPDEAIRDHAKRINKNRG